MLPADLPPVDLDAVQQHLESWAQQACAAETVEVHSVALAPQVLEGAVRVDWSGDPCHTRPSLELTVTTAEKVRTLTVQPRLTVWVPVPVAAHAVDAGERVTTTSGTARIQDIVGAPVSGAWTARVALTAGEPVTDAVVEPELLARRGDSVEIVLNRGGLTLRAQGQLLQDGRRGDRVSVTNSATRTTVRGVLVASTRVEVP